MQLVNAQLLEYQAQCFNFHQFSFVGINFESSKSAGVIHESWFLNHSSMIAKCLNAFPCIGFQVLNAAAYRRLGVHITVFWIINYWYYCRLHMLYLQTSYIYINILIYSIHPCFWTNIIWRCPRWLHLIASWSNWSLLPLCGRRD